MNAAGRILSIYDKLIGKAGPHDQPMVRVWAQVFGLSPDAPHIEDDVVICLQALRSEIDLLRSKLLERGAPDALMHPGLPRLRNATSTVYLNSQWAGIRDETSRPENRVFLLWANWTLRDEDEVDMPADELMALQSELDALEKSLQETDMTPYLRGFIRRQIEAIRMALRVYGVQGVKPIEEALHQVAGAYTIEKARVEAECSQASEPAKSVFARAGTLIEKTAKVADNLDKIRKAGEGIYTLAAGVGPILLSWGPSLTK